MFGIIYNLYLPQPLIEVKATSALGAMHPYILYGKPWVYITTKIHFLTPPHLRKSFFIPVTTFSGGAVGYNIWWQLWDTNSLKN